MSKYLIYRKLYCWCVNKDYLKFLLFKLILVFHFQKSSMNNIFCMWTETAQECLKYILASLNKPPSKLWFGCCKPRKTFWWTTSWWGRDMESFSSRLALCEGNPSVIGGFLSIEAGIRSSDAIKAVEQTLDMLVIWYAMMLMRRHCNDILKALLSRDVRMG